MVPSWFTSAQVDLAEFSPPAKYSLDSHFRPSDNLDFGQCATRGRTRPPLYTKRQKGVSTENTAISVCLLYFLPLHPPLDRPTPTQVRATPRAFAPTPTPKPGRST